MCGKSEATEENVEEMTRVLVKCSSKPPTPVALDDLILLQAAEIRSAWRRSGVFAEECLMPGLASKELALNFPSGKRKRGLEHLGYWLLRYVFFVPVVFFCS